MLTITKNVSSILEVGSNVGVNLRAIKRFDSDIKLYAVEPNETAIDILIKDNVLNQKTFLKHQPILLINQIIFLIWFLLLVF